MTPVDRPIIIWGVALVLASQVHWIFYLMVLVLTFDIVARYRDYLYIRGHKFQPGMARLMQGSWCSRGVAEYVWPYNARLYYKAMGYRWYHILPVGFPGVFLNWKFWFHVVGLYRRG